VRYGQATQLASYVMYDRGYFLMSDYAYSDLAELAITNLLTFSSYPIYFVAIGWAPLVRSRRVLLKLLPKLNLISKAYWCQLAAESPFTVTCKFDVDTVFMPNVDSIFDWWKPLEHTIHMAHPHNFAVDHFEQQQKEMGSPPSRMPYVHSSPCIFSDEQKPFLIELDRCIHNAIKVNPRTDVGDERFVNHLLRKRGAHHCMPYGIIGSPSELSVRYRFPWTCGFHGLKNLHEATKVFKLLKLEHSDVNYGY